MSDLIEALSTAGWPSRLLTLADWEDLPEDDGYRVEVSEGVVSMVPQAHRRHGVAAFRLAAQLDAQVPSTHQTASESDIIVTREPLTVRVPDVLVVLGTAFRDDRPRLDAADVTLVVEVASPGTRRVDRVTKASEYAEAGIACYWLVELDPHVALTELRLADSGYEVVGRHRGRVRLELADFAVLIDLDALTR